LIISLFGQVAIAAYEQLLRDHPKPIPDYLLKNAGISYTQAGQIEKTAKQPEYVRRGVEYFMAYEKVAPPTDQDLPNIRSYLQQVQNQRRV